MNYRKLYVNLISRAKSRIGRNLDPKQKYELHHYFPVCFWRNKSQNTKVVPLTLREHWIAHRLLFKMFPCQGTAAALLFMGKRSPKMNSRKFEAIRLMTHNYNWAKTEEGREYLSMQAKKRWQNGCYESEEARQSTSIRSAKMQEKWRQEGNHPLSSDAAKNASSERAKLRNKQMNVWLNKEKGKVARVCDKCGTEIHGGLGNMKQHQKGRKCHPSNKA